MKILIKGFVNILEHFVWQVTFMYFAYFFFRELQQELKKNTLPYKNSDTFPPSHCTNMLLCLIITIFTLPKILKKTPSL